MKESVNIDDKWLQSKWQAFLQLRIMDSKIFQNDEIGKFKNNYSRKNTRGRTTVNS